MKKHLSKLVRKCYDAKSKKWYSFPFYFKFGKYRLCAYAMNIDFDSLRIKVEKDNKTAFVIKKGIYV